MYKVNIFFAFFSVNPDNLGEAHDREKYFINGSDKSRQ